LVALEKKISKGQSFNKENLEIEKRHYTFAPQFRFFCPVNQIFISLRAAFLDEQYFLNI
jgi:hypothetical protein